MPSLKVLLWLAAVGLAIGLAAAITFAWSSPGSRTIAIATATLFGAALLFGLQVMFDLRPSEERGFISVEYTIDRGTPLIRQWAFENLNQRLHYELEASSWLATNQPEAFSNGERLTADITLAEILLFFAHKQPDWQLTTTRFVGKTSGTLEITNRVSQSIECTELRPEDIETILSNSGNGLARFRMSVIGGSVCLPPNSTISLRGRELIIANQFGALHFDLVPSAAVSRMKPGSGGEVPQLSDGTAQFETRIMGIRVTNTKSGLYSQHRDATKYDIWRKNVMTGLHEWFDGQTY